MQTLTGFGGVFVLVIAVSAILVPATPPILTPSTTERGAPLPGVYSVTDLILDARHLYGKMIIIRNADVECVDEMRCFLTAPRPFGYVISIGFSSLSPQSRLCLFLAQSKGEHHLQITGVLLGDVVDAISVQEELDGSGANSQPSHIGALR